MTIFKMFFRFLDNNRFYTFINVLGLSISLMFVILIANFAIKQFTLDNFHSDVDRVYALGDENYVGTAYRIGAMLKDRYPEIEATCGVVDLQTVSVELSETKVQGGAMAVDSNFFDIFSFDLISGDKNQVLLSKNSVVISEKFAEKMFSSTGNPVGQFITIADSVLCSVSGVFKNLENTVLPDVDMIINIENMIHFNQLVISESLGNAGTTMFLKIVKGGNIFSKTDDMLAYFKTFFWKYKDKTVDKVIITPMTDIYFSSIYTGLKSGDKSFTNILGIVGLVILIFAIFNYINLTVAQTGFRAKEMSTHRLFGASKHHIFLKMIFESVALCTIAFLLGLFFAVGVEPYVNSLITADISVLGNLSADWIVSYIALVVIVGVLSGVIPAVVISRFQPIDVVKGSFTFKSKMIYSKVFITIQSAITVVLLVCSITMIMQVKHLVNADLGYKQKGIIAMYPRGAFEDSGKLEEFRNRLKSMPIIKDVGFARGSPLGGSIFRMRIEGVEDLITFRYIVSDLATMEIFDYEIVKDNNLAENGVWLNETAMRLIGADENANFFSAEQGKYMIKGVLKDYWFGDILSGGAEPLMLQITENVDSPTLFVEINSGVDLRSAYFEVETLFNEITSGAEFWAEYMDEMVAEYYENHDRISTIMLIFTAIAILLSSLGLFAMAIYFTKQRSKEIAVRKVFGSTRKEVLIRVIWQFMRLVLVAFIVACPIVWLFMSDWLQDFSYRINLSIWIFIVAGFFTVLISFVTVYWQSSNVANINPIKTISQ